MNCPACGCSDLRVTTAGRDPEARLRIRRCHACKQELRTVELAAPEGAVVFRAPADGSRRYGSRPALAIRWRSRIVTSLARLAPY